MPGRNLQARHSGRVGRRAPGSERDLDTREERTLPFLRRGVEAGDAAERGRPADAVLAETARGIPARVEPGDDLAAEVDDLRTRADPDAGIGVVERRRVPGRVERGVAILCIGRGFLKSASTPESTKEL